ncbi:hypothetical protein [Cohaesibacter gelatinilyticus]|uniref:Uncharacterized protein n=1 Tax=Cohaesibacter gelatinilyticus TaxID=372072 RepID=A0A285PLI3_9HYPH|nr:hypothetical protein [Cohaesibacter gelatinilyticus]SNZ20966.1 hypothetical protein SAMN06265368_4080 [Cohaesibacter gelatinilyticus]
MRLIGTTGFTSNDFNWALWPKDGFTQLHTKALSDSTIATKAIDGQVSYWFTTGTENETAPDGASIPAQVNGITFFGNDLAFDENGALIGGVLTGIIRHFHDPEQVHGPAIVIGADLFAVNVTTINANPAAFWATVFDFNDVAVISQSVAGAELSLGKGDDLVFLSDVMDQHGQKAVIDLGEGDDFIQISDEISATGDLMPASLTLGEGFDDVIVGSYQPGVSFIEDFNPDEDQILFTKLDPNATIVDNGGEGVTINGFHIKGITEDQVKLENGFLRGVNDRDYSVWINQSGAVDAATGSTNKDVFSSLGVRSEYRWRPTEDGTGVEIWKVADGIIDTLHGFEHLRFVDGTLSLADWPTSEGPIVDGIKDIADQTQYLTADNDVDTFIIDADMAEYRWAPTRDKSGTVVWNAETGKHDILTDFAYIQFNDAKADLALVPRSNVPLTQDKADENEALTASSSREVFEIDGNRDDYSWAPNEDGDGILIWNATNIDVLIGFDGVRFKDAYIDLEALPSWGSIPRPVDEILVQDDPNTNQYLRGVTGDEIFVFDGNMADYTWSATRDKKGVVVWNDSGFDILMDYKAVRFNDGTITTDEIRGIGTGNGNGVVVQDIAGVTQYLHGAGDKDQFVIDGNAEDYGWGATRDGTGFVIWNRETSKHDILTGFEEVVFDDQVLVIDDVLG